MISLFQRFRHPIPSLVCSQLFNDQTFYRVFEKDLAFCQHEAVIESPFLTVKRVKSLLPSLRKAVRRGVVVTINTKSPDEQEGYLGGEARQIIPVLQEIGVRVLFTGGHHRKLAIFDRKVLWEGSLNILSQNDSCEIMRRIDSKELAGQMISFTKLNSFLN
jgi:phosphatidylserine/phosphatidylglycerophosphate/cardiolipin synthase-like enzyme